MLDLVKPYEFGQLLSERILIVDWIIGKIKNRLFTNNSTFSINPHVVKWIRPFQDFR